MSELMKTISNYSKQPSTWRGLISIAGAVGIIQLSPEVTEQAVQVIMQLVSVVIGLNGIINVIRNEKK